MIFLLSPAKTMATNPRTDISTTTTLFTKQTGQLLSHLQGKSVAELAELMNLSDNLAQLNYQRYAQWESQHSEAKAALFYFLGDVYQSLDAQDFSDDEVMYAQEHLRIISGLYGLLRPLDAMQAYRLEMGTKLAIGKHKNLYQFWGSQLTEQLSKQIAAGKHKHVINLASNEYSKAIQLKDLPVPTITPHFKEKRNGKFKVIAIYAKKARGAMVRYAAKHQLEQAEKLKQFTWEQYKFIPTESTETDWLFAR